MNWCCILLSLCSSRLQVSSWSGSTLVVRMRVASLRRRKRQSSSGSSMWRSIHRSWWRRWMCSRLSTHMSKSFWVCLWLLESMTSLSLPPTNSPQAHFISCGQIRMPCPLYSPPSNSPTYLFPLLKYFSPQVSSTELRQYPRSMVFRQRLLAPDTSACSAQSLKPRPCSSPSWLQYPIVSWLCSHLTCMFSGFSKVSSNACSCFTPTVFVIAFRLKTSSLSLRSRRRIFQTTAPFSKTTSNSLAASQSIRHPTPLALSLASWKGILMMNLPTLQAMSYQCSLLKTIEVIEFSLKITLCPAGISFLYSVITDAPSSCKSSPFPFL